MAPTFRMKERPTVNHAPKLFEYVCFSIQVFLYSRLLHLQKEVEQSFQISHYFLSAEFRLPKHSVHKGDRHFRYRVT